MDGSSVEFEPGSPPRIGPWRVAAILGTGSWCTVYLAMDEAGRWAALKMPRFDRMGDPRSPARFRNEVEAARQLHHPGFVSLLDARQDAPFGPWMALEVCEGGTLGAYLDEHGALSPFQALELGVRVVTALTVAHQVGVVQRRMGPDEVLLDRKGSSKLADFQRVANQALPSDSADVHNDLQRAAALIISLLTGSRQASEPPESTPEVLRDVLIKAQAQGRGQGYANAAAMARDLEVAMLDVSVPSGQIRLFEEEDVALPDRFEALFDPDEPFEELQRYARWAVDPSARPREVGTVPPSLYEHLSAPHEAPDLGPRRPSVTRPRAPARRGPREGGSPLTERTSPATLSAPIFEERPAASSAHRVVSSYKPNYLADEQTRAPRDEAWRMETPSSPRREEVPPEPRVDLRIAVLIAGVAVLLVAFVVGAGAWNVREARIAADEAVENLTAVVDAEAAVVNDLVALGADRSLLEERFFAYKDARGPKRYPAADQFAEVLRIEAEKVGVDPEDPRSSDDTTVSRVKKVLDAQRRYHAQRDQWGEVASGFPGIVSVTLGLSRVP